MAYLCKGVASLTRAKAAAKDATGGPPAHRPRGGEQKVLGGAQILLGAVCIGLGVIFSLAPSPEYTDYYYYNRVFHNGVPFWMGSLFILSGTFSVVGARHGGNWVHLATFLNLGSVVAGSVAFTVGLTEIPSPTSQPYFVEVLCKHRVEDRSYRSWEPTNSPQYDYQSDQEWARKCQEVLWALVVCLPQRGRRAAAPRRRWQFQDGIFERMWSSTQILLLILHTAALVIALFCFGYGLHRLCCSCWGDWKDYMAVEEADAPPAPEEPGKEQNPA